MKIIILSDDFPPKSGGGAAVIAYTHASALVSKGHDVLVITTVEDKNKIGQSNENGMRVIRLYSKYHPRFRSYLSLYNPFILSKLIKILEKEKPDITHIHNIHYHFSYHSIKLTKKYSKAVFITIHDSMPFHYSKLFPKYPYEIPIKSYKVSLLLQLKDFRLRFNPFKNLIIKYYLSLPNKIFAVSHALKNALFDNGINNVKVIHNGIDLEKWRIDSGSILEFKKEFNLIDKKVIMFCGRLSRAKGSDVLMKIMPDLIKEIPNVILLIVGEKEGEIDGNNEYLRFTGKIAGNRLISAYGASNMLVVPSLCFDWFPTVNLEAMAMRKPIIATCFGGSSEAILENINGYIINPYNKGDLIIKIFDLLKDDNKAIKFGEAGYEQVRNLFNLEKYIEKTFYWYNKFTK